MPKISILITSYSPESKRYLDLCIRSIKGLDYPGEIEIILVGRPDYLPEYMGVRTVSPAEEKFFPPVGLNCGLSYVSPDSKLYLVLNDDTILTKDSLTALVAMYQAHPQVGLLMPISNDQQGRYTAHVGLQPGPYRYESLYDHADALMSNKSVYPPALSYHDTLCIYAFLISKEVWAKVGEFDEDLMNNDDIDYTMRMRHAGFQNAIAYNAIIYHFGGVSADNTFTPEIRDEGLRRFRNKWMNR